VLRVIWNFSVESAGFAISGGTMVWMGRTMEMKRVGTMQCERYAQKGHHLPSGHLPCGCLMANELQGRTAKSKQNEPRKWSSNEKKCSSKKIPGPDGFPGESYQLFKGALTPTLHTHLKTMEAKGTLPTHSVGRLVLWYQKLTNTSPEHRSKDSSFLWIEM